MSPEVAKCTVGGLRTGGGEEGLGLGADPAAMAGLAVGETKEDFEINIV
jgi:hypothetical protein